MVLEVLDDGEEEGWSALDDDQLRCLTQLFTQEEEYVDDEDSENETEPIPRLDLSQDCNTFESVPKQPFLDDENKCFIDIWKNGEKVVKVYKLNEAFRCTTDPKLANKIFVIDKLISRGDITKKARCKVFVELKNTFIGKKQSSKIDQKYVLCKFPETIPLKRLDTKCDNPTESSLIYESNQVNKGVGFFVAYEDIPGQSKYVEMGCEKKPTVLELFAGAGGMSLGLTQAGFNVKWIVEQDQMAISNLYGNLKCNNPDVVIFDEDVNLFFEKLKQGHHIIYNSIQPDHIHASPPCQGFSSANRNGGKDDEKNNKLTDVFIKIVHFYRPRTVSMENVVGMCNQSNIHYAQMVVASLIRMGYQVRLQILDSSHYGDPQCRHRIFVVAAKCGCKLPSLPIITHGSDGDKLPIVTVKDVLGDLEPHQPTEGSGMVVLAGGQQVGNHNDNGTSLQSEGGQLIAGRPAMTVMKGNYVEHYSQKRALTVREFARLQSFPDSYRFFGSHTKVRSMIGNAVPVNFAKAISESVMLSYNYGILQSESSSSGNSAKQRSPMSEIYISNDNYDDENDWWNRIPPEIDAIITSPPRRLKRRHDDFLS